MCRNMKAIFLALAALIALSASSSDCLPIVANSSSDSPITTPETILVSAAVSTVAPQLLLQANESTQTTTTTTTTTPISTTTSVAATQPTEIQSTAVTSNATLAPLNPQPELHETTELANLTNGSTSANILTYELSPEQQQQQQQQTKSSNVSKPLKSSKEAVLEMFNKFFVKPRSHDDQQQKEQVRDGVVRRLHALGFETSFVQKSQFEFRKQPAFSYNMISILPGKHRHTSDERILLVGAHWDSATKAPGVDDNGSGSVCLLEIARLLSDHKCKFNHTIMLVWFDYEEQGKFGSEFFVNDYLFPFELEKYNSQFIGAYIMDMILVSDKDNFTQNVPSHLSSKLPEFGAEMERDKYRGDFLATWARKTHDEFLETEFRNSWTSLGYESRSFKALHPVLPKLRLPNSNERVHWSDFFRSDHASFWFPALTNRVVHRAPNRNATATNHQSLNAILLTDLGPWRKSYSQCYHSPCDDAHFLTDSNLAFMQQVVDTLVLTLMRVAQGECHKSF